MMSSFWSAWVIVLTVVSLAGVLWILLANRTAGEQETDRTTGHAADGIEEYDNPLPYWWFLMFLITIIFGVGYLIAYPGLGNFQGLLGWTQIKQWQAEVDAADERFSGERFAYLAMPIEEVAAIPAAMKMGQRMFANNCASCHGADGKGSYGFPNLTDTDWLYGGEPDTIKTTLVQGRKAAMPAWGDILGDEGVRNVTAYTLSLSGRNVDSEHAAAGKTQYDMFCVACHMPNGQGNPLFGAPNLANGIWLYGGDSSQVAHSIRAGRNGEMPAFADLLSEDKIHIISAYVYSLSRAAD
jgi:cytochrome c oxidase cbb3-type subunit 3